MGEPILALAALPLVVAGLAPRDLVPYRVHIAGKDFYPGDSVRRYVNNRKVTRVRADRSGRFAVAVEVQLPPGTEPTVTAISGRGGGMVST